MADRLTTKQSVNVLMSNANWAWPQAVAEIFRPRGINALLADSADDMVRIVANNRIHLAILDMVNNMAEGLRTLKLIRRQDRMVPCILLAQQVDDQFLAEALALNVFSVLNKPVNLRLLAGQINRLFLKYYASDLFSEPLGEAEAAESYAPKGKASGPAPQGVSIVRWTIRTFERSKDTDEDQTTGR